MHINYISIRLNKVKKIDRCVSTIKRNWKKPQPRKAKEEQSAEETHLPRRLPGRVQLKRGKVGAKRSPSGQPSLPPHPRPVHGER